MSMTMDLLEKKNGSYLGMKKCKISAKTCHIHAQNASNTYVIR